MIKQKNKLSMAYNLFIKKCFISEKEIIFENNKTYKQLFDSLQLLTSSDLNMVPQYQKMMADR